MCTKLVPHVQCTMCNNVYDMDFNIYIDMLEAETSTYFYTIISKDELNWIKN